MAGSKTGFWATVGRGLDMVRAFIGNLLLILLLVIVGMVLLSGPGRPDVPDGGALLLDPNGALVEQTPIGDPLLNYVVPGGRAAETALDDVLKAIRRAADDDRIALVVLDLDALSTSSLAALQSIGTELTAFKERGKPVWAVGDAYTQAQYFLASHADALYLNPMGQVLLTGVGGSQPYFGELLNRLRVNVHVFRVGEYKSAVEPFTGSGMSEAARANSQQLVDGLWREYVRTVAENRQLDPSSIQTYADEFDMVLDEVQGDMARAALERHLVDELLTRDQMNARVVDRVGADESGYFRHVTFSDYLLATDDGNRLDDRPQVGIIRAEGPVLMGDQRVGAIGADSLSGLIRQARDDELVHALVLRIDSPGGSAYASELIRQELELTQLAGKPVVVSMAGVAASGGYWIAATADRIVASPATVTGSIGIFGIVPTFDEALAEVGVRFDGVGTTKFAGALNPMQPLNPKMARVLQSSIDYGYERFVNLVARGRGLEPEEVDGLAQGRVWTGRRALEVGLVDELGDLSDAVRTAASLAGLDSYAERDIYRPLSPRERLLDALADTLGLGPPEPRAWSTVRAWLAPWRALAGLNDPGRTYALCLVCFW